VGEFCVGAAMSATPRKRARRPRLILPIHWQVATAKASPRQIDFPFGPPDAPTRMANPARTRSPSLCQHDKEILPVHPLEAGNRHGGFGPFLIQSLHTTLLRHLLCLTENSLVFSCRGNHLVRCTSSPPAALACRRQRQRRRALRSAQHRR